MKRILLQTCALAALLVSSCTKVSEKSFQTPDGESLFYASIEASADTRAYADENLRVLWDADDRVSIFNRYTLNEQFRFTGETGDNSGWFEPVPQEAFGTGNELDLVYAVYPYRQSTSISNSGILTVELPDYQVYRQGSFGLGANTMVSATEDNHLLFRNACGYLVLKLYGKDVKVSSITLYGSFEEPIAGKAQVKMTPDGVPELKMSSEAATRVTLSCMEPVALGATPNEAVEFWFALAPVTFEKGFYVEVTDSEGQTHVKFTKNTIEVPRNRKVTMSTISLVWPPGPFIRRNAEKSAVAVEARLWKHFTLFHALRFQPFSAQPHQGKIRTNSVKPGTEGRVAPKIMKILPGKRRFLPVSVGLYYIVRSRQATDIL